MSLFRMGKVSPFVQNGPGAKGCPNWLVAAVTLLCAASTVSCGLFGGRSKQVYLDNGNRLFQAGKYAEASINYRKAIQKDQAFAEAYYRLALAEEKDGRPANAYQALTRAVELQPQREEAQIKLGEICLRAYAEDDKRPRQLYDQIKRISDELLARRPSSFEGLRFKGYLALTDKRTKEAIELFRQADAVKSFQPELSLPLMQSLMLEEQFAECEKLGLQQIEKNKTAGDIYDALYRLYQKTKRPAEGERILVAKVENNPKEDRYVFQLARHYAMNRKPAEVSRTLERILGNPRDFPFGRLQVGSFYSSLGDFEQALPLLEQAKAESKEKVPAQKAMARVFLAQGKKAEAARVVDEILREHPTDADSKGMRALLLLDSGGPANVAAAGTLLETLVKDHPADINYRFHLGRAYMVQGKLERARAELLEVLRQNRQYPSALLLLAELGLQRKQPREALQFADEALADQPNHSKLRLVRCTALIATGSFALARAELARLIKDQPKLLDAQLQFGLLNFVVKRYQEADQIFQKLYVPGQPDLRPLEGLVDVRMAQNQPDSALQLAQAELKKTQGSSAVRQLLVGTAVRAGKYDLALEELKQLERSQPDTVGLYLQLGTVYHLRGDLENSIASLQKAAERAPEDPAALNYLSSVLSAAGRKPEALVNFQQLLKRLPDHPLLLNNVAFLLAETDGNLDEALRLAQRAKQKLPENPGIADTLGWIYLKKGMTDSALQTFQQLARKYPEQANYRFHLGLALLQKGDKTKAQEELRVALAKRPSKDVEIRIREAVARLD